MRAACAGLWAAGLAAGLGGCAGSRRQAGPNPEAAFGAYRFAQRMPEDGSVLEGQFILTRDTIIVRPVAGHCEYEPRDTDLTSLVYQCGTFKLRFERSDPARRVTYDAIVMVKKPAACRTRGRCDPSTVGDLVVPETRSGVLRAVRIGS